MSDTKKKRMIHYDLLRILAAFSVVILHTSAQFWYTLDIHSTEWVITNSYDAVFRFGVPIFVMISGALFLDKDYKLDVKRLYKHNILRMVVVYGVWSCLYGLYDCLNAGLSNMGVKDILRKLLYGRYHLWFLPMIIGIYMLLPVLKSWIEHAELKNLQYFLKLFFIFQILSWTLRALTVTDELHYILDLAEIELVCSYVGYFIWGYYLAHVGVGQRFRKAMYLLALPSALLNILLGNWLAWRRGEPVGNIYDSYGIFTFIIVTALFLLTLDKGSKLSVGPRSTAVIKVISKDTLGIYLIHIGLIDILARLDVHTMTVPIALGVPLLAVLVFVIGLVIVALLRRIPVLGKYLC